MNDRASGEIATGIFSVVDIELLTLTMRKDCFWRYLSIRAIKVILAAHCDDVASTIV